MSDCSRFSRLDLNFAPLSKGGWGDKSDRFELSGDRSRDRGGYPVRVLEASSLLYGVNRKARPLLVISSIDLTDRAATPFEISRSLPPLPRQPTLE
ncbi:MAG: hypothetical protein D6680_21600 [Cyanobacteria bacterium J007]|nr:MAG: hypothetical protein D6680_21600 [Cyanobacteria bacterium J007]